jgi:hypothetical protein
MHASRPSRVQGKRRAAPLRFAPPGRPAPRPRPAPARPPLAPGRGWNDPPTSVTSMREHLKPHAFTTETAREAQRRSAEARRQNARSARERLGKLLDKDLAEIYDAYRRGWRSQSDTAYRAADAAMSQIYGRPPTELELRAGEAGSVSITLESAFALEDESREDEGPPR